MYLYLQDDATFTITVDGKTFHFQAQDSEERERWIRALEETVLRLVALFLPFFRCLKRTEGFPFVSPGNLEILDENSCFAVIKSVQSTKYLKKTFSGI